MNDSVSNPLLRLTPRSTSSADCPRPNSSARDTAGDAGSFSRMLERRMNDTATAKPTAERPRTVERQPEREPVRSREATREPQRERQPVRDRTSPDSAQARAASGRAPDAEHAEAAVARSGADGDAEPATAQPPATEERPTAAAGGSVAPAANSDPGAAIIAALPVAAAAPAPVSLGGTGETGPGPLASGGAGVQAASIEKLLADVGSNDAKASDKEPAGTKANVAPPLVAPAPAATIAAEASPAADAPQPLAAETQPGLAHANLPASRTETQTVAQLRVHTPVGQQAWAEDVGERLTWMIGRHESKAELLLTPPSLGKLEVSIQLGGDQATAHFVAASAAARDALEQAMPRLREMLQQAGVQLGQASVGTSAEQQAQHGGYGEQHGSRPSTGHRYGAERDDGEISAAQRTAGWQRGVGLVDTFA